MHIKIFLRKKKCCWRESEKNADEKKNDDEKKKHEEKKNDGEKKILIEKDAVGAEAFLRFKVLLLGENARAEVDPELEILCNQVKASHAASVGQIDEEQLFYLMSRGLSKQDAVKLIVEAFLS